MNRSTKQSVVWLADCLTINRKKDSRNNQQSVLILYDPVNDLITGLCASNKPVSISLLDLVRTAVNDFPPPDIIRSDLVKPFEGDIFLPERHHLIFADLAFCRNGELRLECILMQLQEYLTYFPEDESLSIALESFLSAHNCGDTRPCRIYLFPNSAAEGVSYEKN